MRAIDWEPLVAAALAARENAHRPYSGFAVGAALEMEDGSVVAGANVENRSFGLTICAERAAIAAGVARGLKRPRAVAVVTATDPPAPPCGMCRETLAEFAGPDLPVLLTNPRGDRTLYRLADLLPHPFEFPGRP